MTTKQARTMSWVAVNLATAQDVMAHLNTLERGIYFSLLVRCAVRGYLEHDLEVLRRSAGVTKRQMDNLQQVLRVGFLFDKDREVFFHMDVEDSYKMMKETSKYLQFCANFDSQMAKSPLFSRAVDTPTNQPTSQPTNLPTYLPVSQSNNQPVEQEEQEDKPRITAAELIARHIW